MQRICMLEAMAAVLSKDVLESDLVLTSVERDGLVQIMRDEAKHYALAVKVLKSLRKVDQLALKKIRSEYYETHQAGWVGPVGRIARLHEDEGLVMRNMPGFIKVISGVVPEEGAVFVNAVENDEPMHHRWGKDILHRLTDNNEAQRKFVRLHRPARNWPAALIFKELGAIQEKMGIRLT